MEVLPPPPPRLRPKAAPDSPAGLMLMGAGGPPLAQGLAQARAVLGMVGIFEYTRHRDEDLNSP